VTSWGERWFASYKSARWQQGVGAGDRLCACGLADAMLYTFSLPTKADEVPAGPDSLHEVKYDSTTITGRCSSASRTACA
jgi:hypothetical protein